MSKFLSENKSHFISGFVLAVVFSIISILVFELSLVKISTFFVISFLAGLIFSKTKSLLGRAEKARDHENIEMMINHVAEGNLSDDLFYRKDRQFIEGSVYFAIRRMVEELRRIIAKFNKMSHDLKNASDDILDITDNLARGASEQRDSVDSVHNSLENTNESIKDLRDSVDKLMDFTDESSSSILEMTANIEEVTSSANDLSEYVDESATAIEEMVASVNEVAEHSKKLYVQASDNAASMAEMDAAIEEVRENADLTSEISDSVMESAREGRESVVQTSEGLKEIESTVMEATEVIDNLGDQSEEIGKIVKVIKDIADQTNLLALNAAIIAAKAGEEGKGFSVIAGEIRELSERTTGSASEISKMIKSIQEEVDNVVGIMQNVRESVKDGVEKGNQAEQSLDVILERIKKATDNVEQIARATSEQAEGSKRITESIDQMTEMIEEISSATEEQARTGSQINDRADHMRELTEKVFRAMEEQKSGSQSISEGMEKVNNVVADVSDATEELSRSSKEVLEAMEVIKESASLNQAGARELSSKVTSFKHESAFLEDEMSTFELPTAAKGGRLNLAYNVDFDPNLDPAYSQSVKDVDITHLIYDGLIRYGDGTDIHPALASSWTVSQDGTTYRFNLRKDVRFNNGKPFTARDVADSFERVLNPANEMPSTWPLEPIKGAKSYLSEDSDEIEGLKIEDDHTITIELEEPIAFFLGILTLPETFIIPSDICHLKEKDLNSQPVGTGSYKVKELSSERLLLTKNENHYRKNTPHIDEINISFSREHPSELPQMLKNKEIDIIDPGDSVPVEDILELKKDPKWAANIHSAILLSTSFLGFKCTQPPFDDPKVRKAANYAVNKQEIVDKIHGGIHKPARGILPPGLMGYNPDLRGYSHNPSKAKQLLRESGHSDKVRAEFFSSRSRGEIKSDAKLAIEHMEEVGFDIKIKKVGEKRYQKLRDEKKIPFYSTGWFADFADPDNFLHVLFYSEGDDILGLDYQNGEVDELLQKARAETNLKEREELYRDVESRIVEDAPVLLLYHQRGFVVKQSYVGGSKISIAPPLVRLEDLWLKK